MHLLCGKIDTVIIIFHFKVGKISCVFSMFANLPVISSHLQKPNKEGEIVQAQAANSVKTSVPPKEKKTKSKEVCIILLSLVTL